MTAPMPETMSPREKVARIVDPREWELQDFGAAKNGGQMIAGADAMLAASLSKADAILAALASSGDQLSGNPRQLKSGDHAELARWIDDYERDAALDAEDDGDLSHVDDGLREFPMRKVKALIAEVAALRETADVSRADRKMLSDMAVQNAARATEAERKLAEAVEWRPIETAPRDGSEVLLRTRDGLISCSWDWTQNEWAAGWLGIVLLPDDATHWFPLPPAPGAEDE